MTSEQAVVRMEKREEMAAKGIDVHPDRCEITHELHEAAMLEDGVSDIAVAGRVRSIRHMGQIVFVTIQSVRGRLQLFVRKDELGEGSFDAFIQYVDTGDWIGASGTMFTTKAGEKTLRVVGYQFLGKSLHPMPDKWSGMTNTELRYRYRYLDMWLSDETSSRLLRRTSMLRSLRAFLDNKGFLEVDTPILQHSASGALAKPFVTHHHALGQDMYLRIAPETYLKRLVAGGFTKLYEVAKCFRNEGISPQHLQEFTMVEGYSAFENYEDAMALIQEMLQYLLSETFGTLSFSIGGEWIDFSEPWLTVTFRELILEKTGIDIDCYPTVEELHAETLRKHIRLEHEAIETLGRGNYIDLLYKKHAGLTSCARRS